MSALNAVKTGKPHHYTIGDVNMIIAQQRTLYTSITQRTMFAQVAREKKCDDVSELWEVAQRGANSAVIGERIGSFASKFLQSPTRNGRLNRLILSDCVYRRESH